MLGSKREEKAKEYMEILNKMLELEKEKKRTNPIKITICIVVGLGSLMFVALLCCSIFKSGFSLEDILSTMLAFFSIFISIFFYFKANETSTNFYKSSYDFMKDISVTLGKIEERFGEKLNNLNEKISHLDKISNEVGEEIKDKKDDKDKIIDDLMNKANLNKDEKERYKKELEEKDNEIELLKQNKYKAEREARRLRRHIEQIHHRQNQIPIPPRRFLEKLLYTHDVSDISIEGMYNLKKLGIIDENNEIDESALIKMIEEVYN